MRIRMKNVSIMGFQKSEIVVFREEFRKIQYIGRYCLKRGGMNRFWFKKGLGKKEGVVFLKGVDTPMHIK